MLDSSVAAAIFLQPMFSIPLSLKHTLQGLVANKSDCQICVVLQWCITKTHYLFCLALEKEQKGRTHSPFDSPIHLLSLHAYTMQ